MKFIKNKTAWRRWASKVEKTQSDKLAPPSEYPCFAYLVVASFDYQEERANYIYASDIDRMTRQIIAHRRTLPESERWKSSPVPDRVASH